MVFENNKGNSFTGGNGMYPLKSRPTGRGGGPSSSNNNNNNNGDKKENRLIHISNLNRLTKSQTVHDAFGKYGHVYSVELNTDQNDNFDGTANVEFFAAPKNFDIRQKITIDGRHITMKYGKTLSEEQRPTHCHARSLSLGVMLTPTTFVEEWKTDSEVKLSVFYDKRKIRTEFRHLGTTYMMDLWFTDITSDLVVENIGNATYLTIPLKEPAKFSFFDTSQKPQDDRKSPDDNSRITRVPICRANMIPLQPLSPPPLAASSNSPGEQSPPPPPDQPRSMPTGNTPSSRYPVMVCTDKKFLRLETWTVYRIKIDPLPRNRHHVMKLLDGMADYNLVPRKHQLLKQQLTVTPASRLPIPKSHQERTELLDFEVLYLLEANITQNFMLERNLDDAFYSLLKALNPEISCGILNLIAQEKKRVWDPTSALKDIWNKYGAKVFDRRQIPRHCSMLRKVVVTPSSMYIQPPTLETTNRVVRHFSQYSDRFIRVQFTDEGLTRISASYHKTNQEVILNRVYQTLRRGILIGNRWYEYLGFSGSQLREHGSWFCAAYDESDNKPGIPLPPMNAELIRSWMGDFSDIKIVAKHAARIGQCFSSTTATLELEKDQVEEIDDIEYHGFTFTDGVGNISPKLAAEVKERLSLRTVPSAFQFRLGGAKGVLMVSNKLSGHKIQLRPSQIKFTSDHYMLEIVRTSTLISAYLNRQAITLLSALGVADKVFMDRLQSVVRDLNRMLAHSDEAHRILLANADEFGTTRFMAGIISGGFLDRQDPFIKNLLNIFRVTMLKNLKEKAKIPVDKGAFLLGVVDETGVLKADEVYCQLSNENTQKLGEIVKGKCMVFRNPCFHPGDIRVVKAVDCPSLHHLKNVLVFPSVGYRDIPSMCSGGDLDGDDYTIIWDETLMPTLENQTPMDYTPSPPNTMDHVTILHIQKFFVNYMNHDNLGQIANAHLATADSSEKGAMDGRCKRLAQLHSSAVDFPKTGKPADFTDELRVAVFPDFMAKEDKPRYLSKKVLGYMFREISKSDYDTYESKLVDKTVYDTRLRVSGMEQYIGKARQLRYRYNKDLSALMNQYGVKTEAEMISGYIVTWLKRSVKKSEYELLQQTAAAVDSMKAGWRNEFHREFKDLGPMTNERDAKAAAWYYVTYHPSERARDLSVEGGFFSFPWVVDEILISLGKRFAHREPTPESLMAVDESLIKQYLAHGSEGVYEMTVVDDDDDDDGDDDDEDDDDDDDEDDNDDDNDSGDGNDNENKSSGAGNDIGGGVDDHDHIDLVDLDDDDDDGGDDSDDRDSNNSSDSNGDEDDDDEDNDDGGEEENEESDGDVISLDRPLPIPSRQVINTTITQSNHVTVGVDATDDDLLAALNL